MQGEHLSRPMRYGMLTILAGGLAATALLYPGASEDENAVMARQAVASSHMLEGVMERSLDSPNPFLGYSSEYPTLVADTDTSTISVAAAAGILRIRLQAEAIESAMLDADLDGVLNGADCAPGVNNATTDSNKNNYPDYLEPTRVCINASFEDLDRDDDLIIDSFERVPFTITPLNPVAPRPSNPNTAPVVPPRTQPQGNGTVSPSWPGYVYIPSPTTPKNNSYQGLDCDGADFFRCDSDHDGFLNGEERQRNDPYGVPDNDTLDPNSERNQQQREQQEAYEKKQQETAERRKDEEEARQRREDQAQADEERRQQQEEDRGY